MSDLRARRYHFNVGDCFICLTPLEDGREIVIVGPMDIPVHKACHEDEEDEQ